MKDSTKNAFKKLSELTLSKCQTCVSPDKYRCCDKLFCDAVEKNLIKQNIKIEKPNVENIPYMGEKGCVVPPELRPLCTGFACPDHFDDRKFRREYDRLVEKVNSDPECRLPPRRTK